MATINLGNIVGLIKSTTAPTNSTDKLDFVVEDDLSLYDNTSSGFITSILTTDLDCGGNNISNVGNVDGRDIGADGIALDNHIADVTIHRTINDAGTGTNDLLSASEIDILPQMILS